MKNTILFEEHQRFSQWWLWLFLGALGVFALYGFYQQIILGKPFGSKPMSDWGLIVFLVFTAAFISMFYFMTLSTKITEKTIHIRFFPFVNKTIPWNDVEKAEVVRYGFVGGWGIRLGTQYGTAYNMSGNIGLAIQLKSGVKYLLGTQKEEEVSVLLNKISLD